MLKPVTVRLIGGLGNQLFSYYAGAALAAHLGTTLRLDTSWTRHGITDHGIEILAFDLPGEWRSNDSLRAKLSAPGSTLGRVIAKAVRELPALGKPLRIYEAHGVGHDPELLRQPPGTRLRGYFQSWQTVQYAIANGYPRRPNLKFSSAWLDAKIQQAKAIQPIAVHVRRGDYAKFNKFGMLSPAYYELAITRLREQGVEGPIWLFSDEPSIARQALGDYSSQAEVVRSPDGPSTEMVAMSYAAANVIANSTFSWWGSWMGDPGRPVMAPTPWFADGSVIEGLIPPTWSTIHSA